MIINDKQTILDFLSGKSPDYKGREYSDLVAYTDEMTEKSHDHIQWAFPLHEESDHAHTYPVLTADVVEAAIQDETIVSNIKLAKDRMEKFYAIGEYEDIDKQRRWCQYRNHNLLRITRIIRCLRLFGLESEAIDFYNKAAMAVDRLLPTPELTLSYWNRALMNDVWETMKG